MTYELALKLKDAGFPQMGDGHMLMLHDPELSESPEDQTMSRITRDQYVFSKIDERNKYGDDVYRPTLEELIEACGEDFMDLVQNNGKWSSCSLANANKTGVGKTPIEAVANLWLSLKDNDKL